MKLAQTINKGKMHTIAFFLDFFPEGKQVDISLKIADKRVGKIINDERSIVGPKETGKAKMYWESFIETIQILHLTKQYKQLNHAYSLLGKIMDERKFNSHLFDISAVIHDNHPTFMKHKFELEGVMKHG